MLKRMIPVAVAIVLIIILAFIGLKTGVIDKYSYSDETMDMNEYFQIFSSDALPIILADEILEEKGIHQNGQYYLGLDMVETYLGDSRFYASKEEEMLFYTTSVDAYRIPLGQVNYTINKEENVSEYPYAVQGEDGEVYVAVDFLKQFCNFEYEVYDNPKHMQLYTTSDTVQTAIIKKDTALRYRGGVKSEVLKELAKGETVVLLESMETWSKVKTSDSFIGYVENKRLEDGTSLERVVEETVQPDVYASISKDYKINMVWHQVTNETANGNVLELLEDTKSVNTISPTWFALADNDGNFTSLASSDYVTAMHERGIEVWALIDDFTDEADINLVLSNTPLRENLINQLVQTVLEYDIDGINIDFENISAEGGKAYIQFLRELSIVCRREQIVLSVDNYVPMEYTAYYDRKAQGQVADYVVIMGYDEHYAGSETAGSVASINYVEQGIINTIADVPANKVINGIPFYTRIWDVTGAVTSEAVGMQKAKDFIADHGVEATWDDETCQNFAAFTADGKNYAIWIEDAQSVRTKLNVMKQYNLAGVSGWKLGLETADVWDLIEEYLGLTPADTESMDAIAGDAE